MTPTSAVVRNRAGYFLCFVAVIVLGLASRKYSTLVPVQLGKYPGDALWALMVFLLVGITKPHWPPAKTALTALSISFAVEFSQIYQAPWVNWIRETTLGHLVLGSNFHWLDLVAYAIGVGLGLLFEFLWRQSTWSKYAKKSAEAKAESAA